MIRLAVTFALWLVASLSTAWFLMAVAEGGTDPLPRLALALACAGMAILLEDRP